MLQNGLAYCYITADVNPNSGYLYNTGDPQLGSILIAKLTLGDNLRTTVTTCPCAKFTLEFKPYINLEGFLCVFKLNSSHFPSLSKLYGQTITMGLVHNTLATYEWAQ